MKNFLPLTFLFLLAYPSFAQRVMTDGKIIYNVKVDIPPGSNSQMDSVFQGSTFTLYVKGNRSRLDKNLGTFHQTIFSNSSNGPLIVLTESEGTKYLLHLTLNDITRQLPKYNNITFTYTNESKTIAGYQCKKAIARLQDGSSFPVYYTTDIAPGNAFIDIMFKNLKGVPLEYETTLQNIKMIITATSVNLSPVPASLFDIPMSGYREVTLKELQKMHQSNKK